jgi:hypothetical protein
MSQTSARLLDRLRLPSDERSWEQLVALYQPLLQSWLRRLDVPDFDRDV